MATLPDHIGPFAVECDFCDRPFTFTIPVTMRALDKGAVVEVTVADGVLASVSKALDAHLSAHHAD